MLHKSFPFPLFVTAATQQCVSPLERKCTLPPPPPLPRISARYRSSQNPVRGSFLLPARFRSRVFSCQSRGSFPSKRSRILPFASISVAICFSFPQTSFLVRGTIIFSPLHKYWTGCFFAPSAYGWPQPPPSRKLPQQRRLLICPLFRVNNMENCSFPCNQVVKVTPSFFSLMFLEDTSRPTLPLL